MKSYRYVFIHTYTAGDYKHSILASDEDFMNIRNYRRQCIIFRHF